MLYRFRIFQVQWNDIDYMDSLLDFTYDPENYATLPQFVDYLHSLNMKYIMIVDPGIASKKPNDALDSGTKMGVWIKESGSSDPLEGVVWPGEQIFLKEQFQTCNNYFKNGCFRERVLP